MAEPLETLAARVADEPFFFAGLLGAYALSEGLDDAGLAAALGCPLTELNMLRLCRATRTDSEEFWDDIACIAERFGLEPQRLADVAKRGRVVLRFQQADLNTRGSLLAARDRESEPPETSPKQS